MIKQFEQLTEEERVLLCKAPALISFLVASSGGGKVNPIQKKDAIHLAHLKTFTAIPLLLPYYAEVEKTFAEQFAAAEKKYFPYDEEKHNELQKEIEKVYGAIEKLDANYAQTLKKGLERFAKHVQRATHSVFQDFIFPLHIPGLTG